MRLIILYLFSFLIGIIAIGIIHLKDLFPVWLENIGLLFHCILIGGIGGVVYCLRAVYLNACVRKSWDKEWHTWYY
jgi:hypothetical protein